MYLPFQQPTAETMAARIELFNATMDQIAPIAYNVYMMLLLSIPFVIGFRIGLRIYRKIYDKSRT